MKKRFALMLALLLALAATALAETAAPVEVPNPARWLDASIEMESAREAGGVRYAWSAILPYAGRAELLAAFRAACEERGFALAADGVDGLGFGALTYEADGVAFTLSVAFTGIQLAVPDALALEPYPGSTMPQETGGALPEASGDPFAIFGALVQADATPEPVMTVSPQTPDETPQADSTWCSWCLGTGHCRACAGSGKLINILADPGDMLSECSDCNGTGRCDKCDGTGYIE